MSSKRETTEVTVSANNIILDIEGTTTSISFVKDVLFPYVRKHLDDYIKQNLESDSFKTIVDALKSQAKEDEDNKVEGVIAIPETAENDVLSKALVDNVLWQMDSDRKTKALKELQGVIYQEGYKKGDLKGHVYEDVEPSLKAWTKEGKSVYIYSSGSVHAQKLLYGHSEKGDLLSYIKGHFDTTVGMKGESQSYKKILEEISCSPSEAVFLTDIPKEAQAAKDAGILALLVTRDGNAPLVEADTSEFQIISSFEEIKFEQNNKKRKLSSDNDVISENENKNKKVAPCSEPVSDDPIVSQSNEEEKMEVDEDSVKKATEDQTCETSKNSEVTSSEGDKKVVEISKSNDAVISSSDDSKPVKGDKTEVSKEKPNTKEDSSSADSANSNQEVDDPKKIKDCTDESAEKELKEEISSSSPAEEAKKIKDCNEEATEKELKEEISSSSPADSANSNQEVDDPKKIKDCTEESAEKELKEDISSSSPAEEATKSAAETDNVAESTEQIVEKTDSETTEKKTEPEESASIDVPVEEPKESTTESKEVSKITIDEKPEVPKEETTVDREEPKTNSNEETKTVVKKEDTKPFAEEKSSVKDEPKSEEIEEEKKGTVAVNGDTKTNGASHDDETHNGKLSNGAVSPLEKPNGTTQDEAVENGREESDKSVKAGKCASSDNITVKPVIES